ncbi:iron citrate ABC transporter substrate-binding protein, partial [Mammaliicoccus sciuri]
KEDKAKQLLEDQDAKIKKAKDKVTTKENKGEKVLIAVAREDAFQAHTSTSYAGQLLTKLGLDNAVESKNAYEDVNLENLSKINPDKIIFTTDKKNPITDDWKEKAIWKDLKAYKKGQIYQVDRDFWTRFRGINANEYIIKDLQKYNEKK